MKLIIAGSRTITAYSHLVDAMNYALDIYPDFHNISEVVSGTAAGVDRLGEQWAARSGVPVRRFPANWAMYGKSAGMKRNKQMAEYVGPDPGGGLLVVWDGCSHGAADMINIGVRLGLVVVVWQVKAETERRNVKTRN